jgi:glucan biosynthesis protein C
MTATSNRPRRHDLDWLRVIAILLLVFFHSAMPFVAEWGWHLKNAETSNLLLEFNFFMSRWRMAVLFLVSGVGTAYALGRRSAWTFSRQRAKRLLVPLVFGILVVVPPQVYMERLANGEASSYLSFWPTIFTSGAYPAGNFSWHHLWFVAYLAIYTAVLMPLFLWLRGDRGRRAGDMLEAVVRRVGLPVMAAPLALVLATLYPTFPGPQNVVDDLAFLLYYMIFFAYGYLLANADGLWSRIERERGVSLRWAVACTLLLNSLRWNGADPGIDHTIAGAAYASLLALTAWCWVVTILGYAKRWLNRPSRVLSYANEGIYPYYILHQTVIVVLAYYVIPLQDGVFAKFLFLSLLSLVLTAALYEVFVRPFNTMRFLMGVKPMSGAKAPLHATAAKTVHVPGAQVSSASWGSE